jgi:hypothetical protein
MLCVHQSIGTVDSVDEAVLLYDKAYQLTGDVMYKLRQAVVMPVIQQSIRHVGDLRDRLKSNLKSLIIHVLR